MDMNLASVPIDHEGEPKRMMVALPAKTARMVEVLSALQSITQSEAIRRAISTEAFIQNEIRQNSKILIETSDGEVKELVFR